MSRKYLRRNSLGFNARRYTIWRKIERLISWIIRGARWKNHLGKCAYAPCDSLIWASGPWLCYCCQIMRERIAGTVHFKPRKQVRINNLILSSYMWRYVHTRHGTYVWPDTKYIYP